MTFAIVMNANAHTSGKLTEAIEYLSLVHLTSFRSIFWLKYCPALKYPHITTKMSTSRLNLKYFQHLKHLMTTQKQPRRAIERDTEVQSKWLECHRSGLRREAVLYRAHIERNKSVTQTGPKQLIYC